MPTNESDPAVLRCPSAQPGMADAEILGVVEGVGDGARVAYVNAHVAASDDILALAAPLAPTEVYRLSARCEERRCTHFDGARCQLAVRIVERLPEVAAWLPPCAIRPICRWFQQEGRSACLRCPQIVTTNANANDLIADVAGGDQVPTRSPLPPRDSAAEAPGRA